MYALGTGALVIALFVCLVGAATALIGARAKRSDHVTAARRATYALALLLTLAMAVLEAAFLSSDFSFKLVADNSSTTTPDFYKATALWASQAGSLLLWVWILSLFSSAVMFAQRRKGWALLPYANAVLLGLGAFFLVLLLFFDSPFAQLAQPPIEGAGLNPLLRYPTMMFHPPSLYIGYVGFSVPFAFAIGAMITRELNANWLRAVRGYTLLAWMFLTFGVLLGARWSYAELGWGGYWAWDPVENASLMPWLVGTAFLHASIVQQRRGFFKAWNLALVVTTFTLALLGTFLVRSGILSSIHAFGDSTVGIPFLLLIGVTLLSSTLLLVSRTKGLRGARRINSFFSREAIFLINNLLLVGLCFVIFWGTFFPLISEAVTGTKASVGAPWFNRYVAPLATLLVLFTGIGTAFAWGGSSWRVSLRNLVAPAVVGLTAVTVLLSTGLIGGFLTSAFYAIAVFSFFIVLREFVTATAARKAIAGEGTARALASIMQRNRRRYGGYVCHVGLIVLLAGLAASSTFSKQRDLELRPGQSGSIGGYEVKYQRPSANASSEKIEFGAHVAISKSGKTVASLSPSRSYYPAPAGAPMGTIGRFFAGESTSEIGLKAGFTKDYWVAMQPSLATLKGPIREANRRFKDPDSSVLTAVVGILVNRYLSSNSMVTFRVIVNPMVTWVWLGGLTIVFGALIGLWPMASPLGGGRIKELETQRNIKLAQLRDLEMDLRARKLAADDFKSGDTELRAELTGLIAELDRLRKQSS